MRVLRREYARRLGRKKDIECELQKAKPPLNSYASRVAFRGCELETWTDVWQGYQPQLKVWRCIICLTATASATISPDCDPLPHTFMSTCKLTYSLFLPAFL